jgi:alpha-beta hydrolase superfamily lysophospholipase
VGTTERTDILGVPYERRTIDLGNDDEGPVVATLVRRRPSRPTGRAVLYVHGYTDYFFQTHLADFFAERGWDFYAIDLRKYGRSLLPHQSPNFCRDLTDYFPELDTAAKIIREENGNHTLLLVGHSTGGLIISLWAHARRNAGIVDGLFLNSPFFDLNMPWVVRRPLLAVITALARWLPYRVIPRGLNTVYGESLHADYRGEWRYDLTWKPLGGFPVRIGWLAAIRRAHKQLRAGLAIPVPILVGSSGHSFRATRWTDAAMGADTVLDVDHIARWAPNLGRHVTIVRFDGALHDLTLSRQPVRDRVFAELDRWLNAFLVPAPAGRPVGRLPVPAQLEVTDASDQISAAATSADSADPVSEPGRVHPTSDGQVV